MWTRLTTFVLGLFWATMLGLLCWSEFGGQRYLGTGASVETVWRKILTSPDPSALDLRVQGQSIGYCQWKPAIIEGGPESTGSADVEHLEGRIRDVLGYNLSLNSSFNLDDAAERIRVNVSIDFAPNREWTDLKLEFRDAQHSLVVKGSAKDKTINWTTDGESRRMDYDQLQDPTGMLGRFGGPLAAMALSKIPFLPKDADPKTLTAHVRWEADYGWIRILNQKVRCYELSTRVLNREIKVSVSLVGEILRVQLPNGIELINTTQTQM